MAIVEHLMTEPIGRAWRDELVSLPCPGDGAPGIHVVNAATGAAVPAQLSGANAWVRISLQPDERLRLRVEPGAPAGIANRFTLTETDATLDIANGHLTVRVPKSGPFDPGKIAGPILAIQRNGRWIGHGEWGPSESAGRIETMLTDRGPLFAAWATRYIVGGRELARYHCTLHAGEDFIRVRDHTRLGAGVSFQYHLAAHDAPTEWFTYGGGEAVNVQRGPVAQPPARCGREREGEFAHVDFHSGHFQMSYSWMGFLLGNHTAIGVCELAGGHWEIPGKNRIRILRTPGAPGAPGSGVAFDFRADGGSRDFALACGDPQKYAPEKGLSGFCHLRRKYSDIPLEKVRHWVTDWPLRPHKHPTLYPRGTAERWREKLDAWPKLAAAYQGPDLPSSPAKLVQYLVQGGEDRLKQILRGIDESLNVALDHVFDNGYIRLIIFDGRVLKSIVETIDILRWRGELDDATARSFARRAAFLAYCFADRDFWPWESAFRERDDPRSIGDEYWDDIGCSVCPPNFFTEYYTTFGLLGLTYPEHPAANEWIDRSIELFDRNLDFHFYESGAYAESLNYHVHETGMLLHLAVGLRAAGRRDFFEHPKFKANFGSLLDMLAPPSALTEVGRKLATEPSMLNPLKDGRGVMLTNWGNSGYDCSAYVVPALLAIAAGVYADLDAAYARRLMTAWRMGSQEFCTHYLALHLVALGRPDLQDVELNLGSRIVEGLGAVMRAGDVFGWIKCGTASHHNCRDEGGLVLYAHGAPLIGDFGYHTQHEGRTEGGTDTWKHACVTFGGKRTLSYLGTEVRQPPELWRSTPEADLLVAYLPVEYLIPEDRVYLDVERIPRVEHRRFILFVKPYCWVIYDHIPQTPLASTWWVHSLADSVELTPNGARFRGRYGVDLDVRALLPASPRITEGVYSMQRHIRIDQPGAGDYLTVLTPLKAGAGPPRTEWNPQSHCLTIEGDHGVDRVFLSGEDRRFEHEGHQYHGRVALFRNGARVLSDR